MLQGWQMAWTTTLLIGVVAVGAAVLLIMLGVRGRRVGNHPHCGTCEFDLFGLDATSTRCPECGADLRAARAVRVGARQRQPRWVAGGAILSLVAAAALVDAGREAKRYYERAENKPVWWLMRDLRTPAWHGADHELSRRRIARRLTERQVRELALVPPLQRTVVPGALPTATKSIPTVSLDAAVELRRAGNLSDADWETICRHILDCELLLRSPVRHGDPIAFRVRLDWSGVPRHERTTVRCKTISASVDGHDVAMSDVRSMKRLVPDWAGHGGGRDEGRLTLTEQQWGVIDVGRHRVNVLADAVVTMQRAGQPELKWLGRVEMGAAVDVVPTTTSTVQMVVVPSRRDAVRQAVAPWDALRPGWGALHILGRHSAPAPLDLSFDVILRSRGREVAVGSFTTREVGQTSWMLPRVPDGCDERMVDVLLRPSPAEAAKHFGVQTIWGEDVLFRDVLLGPPLPIHE